MMRLMRLMRPRMRKTSPKMLRTKLDLAIHHQDEVLRTSLQSQGIQSGPSDPLDPLEDVDDPLEGADVRVPCRDDDPYEDEDGAWEGDQLDSSEDDRLDSSEDDPSDPSERTLHHHSGRVIAANLAESSAITA